MEEACSSILLSSTLNQNSALCRPASTSSEIGLSALNRHSPTRCNPNNKVLITNQELVVAQNHKSKPNPTTTNKAASSRVADVATPAKSNDTHDGTCRGDDVRATHPMINPTTTTQSAAAVTPGLSQLPTPPLSSSQSPICQSPYPAAAAPRKIRALPRATKTRQPRHTPGNRSNCTLPTVDQST